MDSERALCILVADNNATVRSGLRTLFATGPVPVRVGEVETAADLMAHLAQGGWDVVVLDIGLPDQNGLALLPDLKAAYPNVAVLVLSLHTESFYVKRSLQRGAAGYLSKESAPDELLDAVSAVCRGETYVSQALRSQLN